MLSEGKACIAYQAGLPVNSMVRRRSVADLLWPLNKLSSEKTRVSSPRTGIATVSTRLALLLSTGNRCCSPSLNEPPSAIIRHPNTSYLSVTVNRKLTPVVRPASTVNFCFCVLIIFSVIGSKRIKLTVPVRFFPVRFATEAATEVLSPTRTKRGRFGVSINSLLVTADPSIIPVSMPLVWAYPRKFQRVRLCGIVNEKETSPCSLVRSCG